MLKADTTDMTDVEKNESLPLQSAGPAQPVYSGKEQLEALETWDSDRLLPQPVPKGGFPHLDVTRIVCVMLVAVDHGSAMYSEWNVIYVQQWVLQWIVLVSGVSYCLSSKTLARYCWRLGTYAIVGILVNWTAFIALGLDWQHNFFNVIFQMWFVIGLMLFCFLLAPLKYWLAEDAKSVQEQPALPQVPPAEEGIMNTVLMLLMVLLAIGILCNTFLPILVGPILAPLLLSLSQKLGGSDSVWALPGSLDESQVFVAHLCSYAFLTLSNLFLLRAFRSMHIKPSIIPWVMLLNCLVNRTMIYRGPEERPFHLLDIMILGMVTQSYGLMFRKTVGDYFCRYWFVVLIAFAIIYPPYVHRRLDMHPTHDRELRCVVESMEAICLLAWLSASDRFFSREIFTVDRLGFMNDWALLVFLVHKAMHLIFGLPWSWLVLFALIPVCHVFRRRETAS
ncbi:unnamed protein product [Effrenium voratum]|uniref:Uncharacterized protein n=1 Tax=Effrenium voratum TaxID=2562239 RepID=A0AA36HM67_9DINO|nr:unnamed protein product [Effrenium voratum]CAJ1450825.1 unnamed protein product [Effrenium voratum]